MSWRNLSKIQSVSFTCGFCGNGVASSLGFFYPEELRQIYVCPHCEQPTYVDEHDNRVPGVAPGVEVANVPEQLNTLYREARNCVSVGSSTSAVLTCRKILMNIAVEQGADAGKSFLSYVVFLADSGYVPPNGRGWVDHIRRKGNEATHEIHLMTVDDAKELLSFIEMLLKFIYEFPARVPTN